MLAGLVRLVLRITLVGLIIGAVTAAVGLGAIALSELLSRRAGRAAEPAAASVGSAQEPAPPQELDEEFLALLACPVCKTRVERVEERLVCTSCGRRYPIRDGIPVMLVEEAEQPSAGPAPAG
ncbi:MAG TPA: Trm112 family protein [Chloroflexota bacterium]|nr:Trm112 family protein [Chloroflexota bacterium]